MDDGLIPFPVFSGELFDSWQLHEIRLLSWLRRRGIREDDDEARIDFLLLSLKPNSSPLNWFITQPTELKSTFNQSLVLLKNKFGNDLRKEMLRLSALNCLQVRSFRDNEHKAEMVIELVNELEQLLAYGSVNHEPERREYLLRCFRGFSGALKMMNRATSYDGAVLAALTWESSVISKAEEVMIQVAIKKQLAQRSQNLPASRTKPQSQQNLSQPVTCSEDDQNTNYPDNFMTQDFNQEPFRLHSNFYHKNRLTPSQKHTHDIKTNTSGPSSSNNHHQHGFDQRQAQSHQYSQKPQAPSSDFHVDQTPQGTSIARDDTDPSQPIESLVDPHCVAGPSLVRPSKTDRPADPIEMNPNSTEAVNYHTGSQNNWANLRPQNLRMRPLVYDPEKNPYPPPEKLVENQIPHRIAGHQPSVPFSSQLLHGGQNHSSSLPPSSTFSTHLSQQSSMPFPSTQKSYPFPSSSPPPKFPNPQIPITSHQSASTLPGSSSQQVHNFVESNTNFNSATSSLQQHSNSTYASANPSSEINPQNMKRRPSKLVKLRRPESRGSTGSSIGQRSIASFDRIKNFVGALHKRVSRGSQSWDESDSTQDQGPSTPSPLDLSASGGGFDSEGNEKLRPMQAQFHRLFRKHRHPEHLRRQNRSMLVNKSLPLSQQPIKGKSRALNFGTSPSPINARVLGMGRNDELVV